MSTCHPRAHRSVYHGLLSIENAFGSFASKLIMRTRQSCSLGNSSTGTQFALELQGSREEIKQQRHHLGKRRDPTHRCQHGGNAMSGSAQHRERRAGRGICREQQGTGVLLAAGGMPAEPVQDGERRVAWGCAGPPASPGGIPTAMGRSGGTGNSGPWLCPPPRVLETL